MSTEADESSVGIRSTDGEIKELMGLFDAPAFARRGRDVEWAVKRTLAISQKQRTELLEMVHCRLRMWVAVTNSTDDWQLTFNEPLDQLWKLSDAPEPVWKKSQKINTKAVIKASHGLIQSIERFNVRWSRWVHSLKADAVNKQIDHYNKYYILEKECVVGSARLAARMYQPTPRIEPDWLLSQLPLLPAPRLNSA